MLILAVESLGTAITLIDAEGTLLYYNKQATRVSDRKPEYIGDDVHLHHKQAGSNQKLDQMLQAFREGRTTPFYYEAKPYGEAILVTVSPLFQENRFIGCVQSIQLPAREKG